MLFENAAVTSSFLKKRCKIDKFACTKFEIQIKSRTLLYSGFHRKPRVIKCTPFCLGCPKRVMETGDENSTDCFVICSLFMNNVICKQNAMFCEESFRKNGTLYVHFTYRVFDRFSN